MSFRVKGVEMSRAIVQSCWPWMLLWIGSCAVLWLLARWNRVRFSWARLGRLHADQGGSAQSLSFVLTLPLFILVMLTMVEISQIMIGEIVVHYAAFAAVRSAIVWVPARLPGEPENWVPTYTPIDDPAAVLVGPTDGWIRHYVVDTSGVKYATIRRAAVLACVGISPSADLAPMNDEGLQTWQRLQAAYDAVAPTASWATKDSGPVYNKLAYAEAHTGVLIAFDHSNEEPPLVLFLDQYDPASPDPPEFMPGREIGRQDAIEITVNYDMKLLPGLIPLSRFFQSEISSPRIQWVTSDRESTIPIGCSRRRRSQTKATNRRCRMYINKSRCRVGQAERSPTSALAKLMVELRSACPTLRSPPRRARDDQHRVGVRGVDADDAAGHGDERWPRRGRQDPPAKHGRRRCPVGRHGDGPGLNVLAFTNHLLFDVFALTAFVREAVQVQEVDQYIPEILAEWNKLQPVLARSGFPKFVALAPLIPQETRLEQPLVDTYSAWMSESVLLTRPIMEEILAGEWIPQFQRAVVQAYPAMAQEAAMLVAERNGPAGNPYGRILGVLWGTQGQPVGLVDQSSSRTMPAVDPEMDQLPEQPQYVQLARAQREYYAKQRYLGIAFQKNHTRYARTWSPPGHASTWTDEAFWMFDNVAKMCQFGNLFRGFACGQFDQLFNVDYPQSNLPFVILASNNPKDAPELPYLDPAANNNAHLERYYTFVGVAYRRAAPEMMPGLFRNPMGPTRTSDPYAAVAYATVRVFIPSPRLEWGWIPLAAGRGPARPPPSDPGIPAGGVPGQIPPIQRLPDSSSDGNAPAAFKSHCRRFRWAVPGRLARLPCRWPRGAMLWGTGMWAGRARGDRAPATASSAVGSYGSTGGWSTSIGRCNCPQRPVRRGATVPGHDPQCGPSPLFPRVWPGGNRTAEPGQSRRRRR